MPSSPSSLTFVRQLLLRRAAIVLAADKDYLIKSRLLPVAHKHGFKNTDDLVMHVRGIEGEDMEVEAVDAMTTNETYFFRDLKPFEIIAKNLLRKAR